jgi:hypothetical protein
VTTQVRIKTNNQTICDCAISLFRPVNPNLAHVCDLAESNLGISDLNIKLAILNCKTAHFPADGCATVRGSVGHGLADQARATRQLLELEHGGKACIQGANASNGVE